MGRSYRYNKTLECISSYITNWHLSEDISASDHCYILCDLNFDFETVEFRNPKNNNWVSYEKDLTCKIKSMTKRIRDLYDIESSALTLQEAIHHPFQTKEKGRSCMVE